MLLSASRSASAFAFLALSFATMLSSAAPMAAESAAALPPPGTAAVDARALR